MISVVDGCLSEYCRWKHDRHDVLVLIRTTKEESSVLKLRRNGGYPRRPALTTGQLRGPGRALHCGWMRL